MLFHILFCFDVSGANVSTDISSKQQSGVAKLLQLYESTPFRNKMRDIGRIGSIRSTADDEKEQA
jgi:hypothetical protein